ncbi:hypothetical protein BC831DRAFT_480226 [Entophlyctis helioformis]|nr:hypothetical protein BC831DRAFT_480226 [Entophlyctis helioformis]
MASADSIDHPLASARQCIVPVSFVTAVPPSTLPMLPPSLLRTTAAGLQTPPADGHRHTDMHDASVPSRHFPPLLIPPYDSHAGHADVFLDDVAAVLRDWAGQINRLVMEENYTLYPVVTSMFRFVSHSRQSLRSQSLSAVEAERCRRSIIQTIASGNKMLNLDTILHSPASGLLLSHETLPVMDLYSRHRSHIHQPSQAAPSNIFESFAAASSLSASGTAIDADTAAAPSFNVFLDFKACVASFCDAGESAELFFCIYDATEKRVLTEELLVRLDSHGMPVDLSRGQSGVLYSTMRPFATLFTDISTRDAQNNLLLACRIVRVVRASTVGSSGSDALGTVERAAKSGGVMSRLGLRFGNSGSSNNAGTSSSSSYAGVSSGQGADTVSTALLHGKSPHATLRRLFGVAVTPIGDLLKQPLDGHAIPKERSMQILASAAPETDFVSFDSMGQPDLFQTLPHAETMTVTLAAFDSASHAFTSRTGHLTGVPAYPAAAQGLSTPLAPSSPLESSSSHGNHVYPTSGLRLVSGDIVPYFSCFDSLLYPNTNTPKWSETIRLRHAHLFMTFRLCALATSSETPANDCFAFAFLPLTKDQNAVVSDAYDPRMAIPEVYLNYPAGPNIFAHSTQLAASSAISLSAAADALAKLPALKDTVSVSTNTALLNLLSWRQLLLSNRANIRQILTEFMRIGETEILKFMPSILTELLAMLDATANPLHAIQHEVFGALIFHIDAFDAFVLCEQLERSMRKLLRKAIKVVSHLAVLVIGSASLADDSDDGASAAEQHSSNRQKCKDRLKTVHDGFQYIVSLAQPDHVLASQVLALQHYWAFAAEISRVFDASEVVDLITPKLKSGRLQLFAVHWDHIIRHMPSASATPFDAACGYADKDSPELLLSLSPSRSHAKNRLASMDHVPPHLDPQDPDVVAQSVGVLEELLREIQPGQLPGASPTPLSTQSGIDICTWSSLLSTLLPVFSDGSKRGSDSFGAAAAAAADRSQEYPLSEASARSQRDSQDLGAVIVAILHMLSKSDLEAVMVVRIQTHGAVSTCRLLLQLMHVVRLFIRPDLFDPSWLCFNVLVHKTAMHVFESIMPVLEALPSHHVATSYTASSSSVPTSRKPGMHHDAVETSLADAIKSVSGASETTLSGIDQVDTAGGLVMDQLLLASAALDTAHFHDGPDYFLSTFEACWVDLFESVLQLINSPLLRLENAGAQRSRIVQHLRGDVRVDAARLLLLAWSSCGRLFGAPGHMPLMPEGFIGSLLDLTFGDQLVVSNAAADLLLSLLRAEFASTGGFKRFEGECFEHLHQAIEDGDLGAPGLTLGGNHDPQQQQQQQSPELFFVAALEARFAKEKNDLKFAALGRAFLRAIGKFVKVVAAHHDSLDRGEDERVASTIRVLRFLKNARRRTLFVKYLHSLFDTHMAAGHHAEAAMTLKHHADLLNWQDEIAVEPMPLYGFPNWQTEFERKEQILMQCIKLLERAHLWERAVELCNELVDEYKYHIWDYAQLSDILRYQANLYDRIANEERCYPSYFRVAFYGRGFPKRVSGKQFIYRGAEWEKISSFCERIQAAFPEAQLITKNGAVGRDIEHGEGMYLQITAVQPAPDSAGASAGGMFGTIGWGLEPKQATKQQQHADESASAGQAGDPNPELFTEDDSSRKTAQRIELIPPALRSYYENNEVSIDLNDPPDHPAKEFLELWTEKTVIMSQRLRISPIENAIIAVRTKTKQLLGFERKFRTILDDWALSADGQGAVTAPCTRLSADSGAAAGQTRPSRNSTGGNGADSGGNGNSSGVRPVTEMMSGSVVGAALAAMAVSSSAGGSGSGNSGNSGSTSSPSPATATATTQLAALLSASSVNPFTMALNGAVDAPVNGGIPIDPPLGSAYNTPKLRDTLLADILDYTEVIHRCLMVHEQIVPAQMRPLHDEIIRMFQKNYAAEISQLASGSASGSGRYAGDHGVSLRPSASSPSITRKPGSGTGTLGVFRRRSMNLYSLLAGDAGTTAGSPLHGPPAAVGHDASPANASANSTSNSTAHRNLPLAPSSTTGTLLRSATHGPASPTSPHAMLHTQSSPAFSPSGMQKHVRQHHERQGSLTGLSWGYSPHDPQAKRSSGSS